MELAELVAREAIRDLISRYNHAGDRGDLDGLCACFAETGVLDLKDAPALEGRGAIRAHLGGVVERLAGATRHALLRHHVSSVCIDVESEDRARAASYFSVFTEIGLDHWGRYGDDFLRIDGLWKIARRKVRVDGAAEDSRMVASS